MPKYRVFLDSQYLRGLIMDIGHIVQDLIMSGIRTHETLVGRR